MSTVLVIVDTEASVCQRLNSHLKMFSSSNYQVRGITPDVTIGEEALIKDVAEKAEQLLQNESSAVFFVDLVVHEDERAYSQMGRSSYDNMGLSIALALRQKFPSNPIFVITGKISVPAEESLLSEASLEDVDGILTKDYLIGKGLSPSRLGHIVAKGLEKRRIALGVRSNVAPILEQKFKILYALEQAAIDLDTWVNQLHNDEIRVGVIFLDIDNFKSINQRFSETVVDDTILKDFQLFLRQRCTLRGSAYRQGGEEFLILLPNCNIDEAASFGKSLCREIAEKAFRVKDSDHHITVSVGVSEWRPEMNISDVIKEANQAEHRAKELGKNRVETFLGNV